jgi:phenylpropionate dioxygenase-like ring-hydroxylating dioxygenase large terminal subunit
MNQLLDDAAVVARVLQHIDNKTTDLGEETWLEPVENYRSWERLEAERELLKRLPVPFCPSAALPESGSYVARSAAGTPIVAVRDENGSVRAFRNACRHRGMQVAQGSGTAKYFVCSYHGWTYRLDGGLHHVPHEEGFPDLDVSCHGLVPVQTTEQHGLVFVTQEEPIGDGAIDGLDDIPVLLDKSQRVFAASESESDLNWKLNMESTLEGYHIRTTHPESFYPYGYDNLNVVETFGRNSRITFPFRRIEKLRDMPADAPDVSGKLTYVYNLFPNVTIAVLSNHTVVSISEPVSPTRTRFVSYRLNNPLAEGAAADLERAERDANFVADASGREDAAAVSAIQAGLDSGANDHFTFGRFEKAIVHFHQGLTESLQRLELDGDRVTRGDRALRRSKKSST